MSSTLFSRGTNAQLGMRERSERIERELTSLRAAVGTASVQKDIAELREKLSVVDRKIDFQLANLIRQVTSLREELKTAQGAIADLKTIITPPTESI